MTGLLKKSFVRFRLVALLAAIGLMFGGAAKVRADGAVAIASGPAGPFEISVFVARSPLRVGSSAWSVLVRERVGGRAVLDADVEIGVRPRGSGSHARHAKHDAGSARRTRARRAASSNRLLHTASIALPSHGIWDATVSISSEMGAGELSFEVPVSRAVSPILEHWRSFALPVLGLGLLAFHQRLRR
jgi:hypothetical protein